MSSLPIITVVDDDPAALAAMREALARRFGGDYRVVSFGSARAALDALARMKDEEREIALVIADQWMPEMPGNELLGRVHSIEPMAKRALLVDWGDHSASSTILKACAFGEIENYLYKPWVPAEVHLYPLINEFLAEWTMLHRPGMALVHVVAEEQSERSNEIRELLNRNGIPCGFHPAGSRLANRLLKERGADPSALPAVLLLDGSILVDPTDAEIMDAVGESPGELTCDVAVVGAGPAGLSAAVYAGSEGLTTLVVEQHVIGGQAGASSLIRNYLGFPRGISGVELTQRAYQQAWLFGAGFVFSREVTGLRCDGPRRILTLSDGREIVATAVVVATGADYRRLDVPSLEHLVGKSIFYTTASDPSLLRGFDVAVVGGGNSAGQAVVHLAEYARRVTLVVRGDSLERGMSDYLVRQIRRKGNVDVRLGAEVAGGEGADRLESLAIRDNATNTVDRVPAAVLFPMIGALPRTDWLAGIVQRDAKGFILTGNDMDTAEWPLSRRPMTFETSVPGIFAVGDGRRGSTKRLASAVGEGAGAVQNMQRYFKEAERQPD